MKKKLSAIEAATNGYKQNIVSIEEHSSNLIGRGHYDAVNIRTKQVNYSFIMKSKKIAYKRILFNNIFFI